MGPLQREALSSNPFGHYIDMPKLGHSFAKVHNLLMRYSVDSNEFQFGDRKSPIAVPFDPVEFSTTLGLYNDGQAIDINLKTDASCPIVTNLFDGDLKNANRNRIATMLEEYAYNDEKVEDFIQEEKFGGRNTFAVGDSSMDTSRLQDKENQIALLKKTIKKLKQKIKKKTFERRKKVTKVKRTARKKKAKDRVDREEVTEDQEGDVVQENQEGDSEEKKEEEKGNGGEEAEKAGEMVTEDEGDGVQENQEGERAEDEVKKEEEKYNDGEEKEKAEEMNNLDTTTRNLCAEILYDYSDDENEKEDDNGEQTLVVYSPPCMHIWFCCTRYTSILYMIYNLCAEILHEGEDDENDHNGEQRNEDDGDRQALVVYTPSSMIKRIRQRGDRVVKRKELDFVTPRSTKRQRRERRRGREHGRGRVSPLSVEIADVMDDSLTPYKGQLGYTGRVEIQDRKRAVIDEIYQLIMRVTSHNKFINDRSFPILNLNPPCVTELPFIL
ncbi:PREDICTED: uncharacterized protein DDB_G0283697-like [Erythranthe guttata]|uniref:uncharacterized protein DDB_G0283697-like n=1 Tax=Erythranthe guttata TaxID=4155 RepID=UPI00064DF481|nr:PREDICTED: uncharacterized protein DDB_G0283697-like [Erythranthe guttata]|eukprot:XP_012841586.1 PREDICTED: uncharacterized protein DDB_G0283697-like [Erythranthe guttata]